MTLILLLFLAALSLEGIGTYISVIGLAATFAADPVILTMAVVLDFCKIIAVNTLAKSWSKLAKTIRGYLIASTLVLSLITSAGVGGYLSNSFQKAMLPNQGNDIALVNIKSEQERLLTRKKEIDTQISQLPPNQVRSRQRLMASFKGETDHINQRLNEIDVELPKLQTSQAKIHTDVGSIMYLAELANITPQKAVGIIIGLIIFVFDPMAIVFMIAANSLLRKREEEKELPKSDPIVIDEDDVKRMEPEIVHEVEDEPEVVPEPEHEVYVPSDKGPLENLEELEDAQVIYKVKRLPPKIINLVAPPTSSTLAIVDPSPEQIAAEVVVEEPVVEEPNIIVPEYTPEPDVEEVEAPYPFPLAAPTEERQQPSFEEDVQQSVEKLAQALDKAEEPVLTTDVEVFHVGEPTPMPVDEGMAILKQALDPIRAELATKNEEPHLEEVLREILKDDNGTLTDEERAKLDRALDRIFAIDPQRAHSDEPEEEETEDHQPAVENVPGAVPDAPEVQLAPSTLSNPELDAVKGSGVQYVGPVFVNPKVLETYSSNQ